MSGTDNSPIESDVPLFNVHASIPSGLDLEEIDRRLRADAHMPEERIDYLINSLRTFPRLQIGANVPIDRANKAREQFGKSGLLIEITPVLSLEKMTAEEENPAVYRCPACSHEGELTEDRRCTKCGIFVDKVTDEELIKRRIMEQERMKYELQRSKDDKDNKKRKKQETEARLREEVRKELESEFGLNQKDEAFLDSTKGKVIVGLGLAVFAVAAFYGGQYFQKNSAPESAKTAEKSPKDQAANVDKMLDAIGPQAGAAAADAVAAATGAGGGAAAGAGAAAGGAAGLPGGGGGVASGPGDFNDPFLDAAAKGRPGTLTMEQAVAASMTLAKSVGNTTAERALNGTLPTAPAGATLVGAGAGGGAVGAGGVAGNSAGSAPGPGASPVAVASPGGAPSGLSAAPVGGAATRPGAPVGGSSGLGYASGAAQGVAGKATANEPPPEVPKQTKLLLTLDFAKHLAELGQSARAAEVIKRVKASPTLVAYPDLDSTVRLTELETQAWGILSLTEGRARNLVESLLTGAASLTDPAERATALSKIGLIVSKNTQLPPEAARLFLTKAAETLKSMPDNTVRRSVMTIWTAALGEITVADAVQRARTGQWAKVKAASTQLDELIKTTSDPQSLARLHGAQYRMRQISGQQDKLTQALQAALASAAKSADPVQQAMALRSISQSIGPGGLELMRSSLDTLKNQASARSGMQRAQALTQLMLIYADAGAKQQADAIASLVQTTPGLKPAEELGVATELLILSELAQARAMHGNGMYAEAENILRRLAGYML